MTTTICIVFTYFACLTAIKLKRDLLGLDPTRTVRRGV